MGVPPLFKESMVKVASSCRCLMVSCAREKIINFLPKEMVTEVPQSSQQPMVRAVTVASDQENITTCSGHVVRLPQRLVAE